MQTLFYETQFNYAFFITSNKTRYFVSFKIYHVLINMRKGKKISLYASAYANACYPMSSNIKVSNSHSTNYGEVSHQALQFHVNSASPTRMRGLINRNFVTYTKVIRVLGNYRVDDSAFTLNNLHECDL